MLGKENSTDHQKKNAEENGVPPNAVMKNP